jgi:hypothetical protein
MTIYTIYQIVCKDSNVIESYVGSTVNLKNRIYKHKTNCTNSNSEKYNTKIYQFIRENGGFNNWKFNILETIECVDEYDSYVIEQTYINDLKSELNSQSAFTGLTKKEYHQKYYKEYNKKYRQENKEKISEQTKKYRQENKEKISEQTKKYRQENKEKISEQTKKYRQENKEKINEKNKKYRVLNNDKINEKYCCLICKGSYIHQNISRHIKTKKHQKCLTDFDSATPIEQPI